MLVFAQLTQMEVSVHVGVRERAQEFALVFFFESHGLVTLQGFDLGDFQFSRSDSDCFFDFLELLEARLVASCVCINHFFGVLGILQSREDFNIL